MKHTALTCLAALTLAACAAPETEALEESNTTVTLAPTGAEPLGADAKPGGKNTYVKGGCEKRLADQLAAVSAPEGWQARTLRASAQNEASGLKPLQTGTPPITRTVPPDSPPMPVKGDHRCQLMFDVSVEGVPTNILSHCTDPSFSAFAKSELMGLRFEPAMANGAETVRKGVITDITVCTTQ